MRYRELQQRQKQGRAQIRTVPAPVGGWNTRDSLDEMDPRDALVLDNMVPLIGKVSTRPGYEDFLNGIAADIGGSWSAGDIETLFTLTVGSTEQFLCAMDGGIARIDSGTAVEVEPRATYTSDRWQYTVFAESVTNGNPQIYAVNGTDQPWKYNGTTHADWAPTMTGGTDNNLVWIFSYKNRIYCGEKDSRNFWYSGLGADTALTEFPLEGIRGAQGNILFAGAMSRDTGSGPDDFIVFVTNTGHAIVYQGTNPADPLVWKLVGVYQIPRPINSYRAHVNMFGDIIIATELDYIPLSAAIQSSGDAVLNPTKLTGAMREVAKVHRANYGWEMFISEVDSLMFSNIPLSTNSIYHQHVVNIQTGAPCRFTGWNFNTFAVWNGKLYGAGNDAVYRVMSRLSDDASGDEDEIQIRAQTAWNGFGDGSIKHVKGMRLLVQSQGEFKYGSSLGSDFVAPSPVAVASSGPTSESTFWGDAAGESTPWGDEGSSETYWAGTITAALSSSREWQLQSARGSDFSLGIAANIKNQEISWLSTDYKLHGSARF